MIITITNQKGGVGKTTTAAALAQAGVYKGKKVLAIDLDPQQNLTFALDAAGPGPGSKELLDGMPLKEIIRRSPQGMFVCPSSWDLSTETTGPGTARRLQNALELARWSFDLVVIDTPPSAGELAYNGIQAAEAIIIPLLADSYSAQALRQIMDTVRVFRTTNRKLKTVYGCITQFDGRSTIARQLAEMIREAEATEGVVDLGTVRAAVAVKEACALQQSLFTYAKRSKPAEDYLRIFDQLNI